MTSRIGRQFSRASGTRTLGTVSHAEKSPKFKPRVAIVGAGVSGLTVGVALAETYGKHLEFTIFAEKFSPDTTSDRAGGIFIPGVGNHDSDDFARDMRTWAPPTYHYFDHLCKSPGGSECGVFRTPLYEFRSKSYRPPSWLREKLYPDYRELSQNEAKGMGLPYQGFESIATFTTFLVRGTVYLPWLMRVFRERGGLITKRKIESFAELSTYDIIINCTGLGARELACDGSMEPARGQIVVVKATTPRQVNGIYHYKNLNLGKFVYIIPFKDIILLGKQCIYLYSGTSIQWNPS